MTDVQHTQGRAEWVTTRDGRKLYAQVLDGPPDAPTVVFECGAGASRSTWALVQPQVAKFARAIVYDRSGMGKSPPDPTRTLARIVDDLCDVIDHYCVPKAGDRQQGHLILVGHSAGGPIIRKTASLRPNVVTSLVLLDPTDEGVDLMFKPSFRYMESAGLYVGLGLSYLGLVRPIANYAFKWMLDLLPEDVCEDLNREAFAPSVVHSQMAMSHTFLDEVKAFRDDPPKIPDEMPVTIVSGSQTGMAMGEETRKAINEAHEKQTERYSKGRHVVAENSGHLVPLTDVELVVDEIRRVL
ncbi:uncharacterized protein EHS24_007079 [Apiotrichum porosum]|uniref:AB hydrolase-1 domain-containing protein n=1 Tax=Apiotrichum porosum TaxID=105984 RepID=A0A427XXE6_9TREE|nr:uncharacterized protein EHS24_007079 [Apiotrichum porosum]RSH83395.1 hypothetical protein EHS24_007079 [Apiotrichum porosum]